MRRSLRRMLVPCLLVTAACTAQGPLAPQLAPEPTRLPDAETPRTAHELVQWLSSAGLIRADGRHAPLYVVDGVIVPGLGTTDIETMDIVAIKIYKGGTGHMQGVTVHITTRAGGMRERS